MGFNSAFKRLTCYMFLSLDIMFYKRLFGRRNEGSAKRCIQQNRLLLLLVVVAGLVPAAALCSYTVT